MHKRRMMTLLSILAGIFAFGVVFQGRLSAHGDGMDGPVVRAAQLALESGNLSTIII